MVAPRTLEDVDSVVLASSDPIAQAVDDLGDLQDLYGRLVQVFSRRRYGFAPSGLKPQPSRRDQEAGSRQILIELMRQSSDRSLNASDGPIVKIFAVARALHANLPTLEWRGLNSELLNQALIISS